MAASRPWLGLWLGRRCLRVWGGRRKSVEIQSESQFRETVLESSRPAIVDFYAEWCGPCRELGPLLEEVASQREGSVHLVKVNIDHLPDLAINYQVSAVPAVLGVRDGSVVDQFVGLRDSHFLEQFADGLIGSASHNSHN